MWKPYCNGGGAKLLPQCTASDEHWTMVGLEMLQVICHCGTIGTNQINRSLRPKMIFHEPIIVYNAPPPSSGPASCTLTL
ncbi:hypothetical protein GDO81_020515 [Engystomops pustulosus]|uniref:Uncharacterized protein n=1 Tax=Engystomops pustulosus TaxID=76066 RepID=A0AAV6Z946_ENGPU|nr:hypothetical protein GDO81_020515 [Engystomops pustulosus]